MIDKSVLWQANFCSHHVFSAWFYFHCLICFLTFHFSVPRHHLLFEAQLVAGKPHEFGPISCPLQLHSPSTLSGINSGKQKHEAELKYPQRIRRLNIFPASKTEVANFYWYCYFYTFSFQSLLYPFGWANFIKLLTSRWYSYVLSFFFNSLWLKRCSSWVLAFH